MNKRHAWLENVASDCNRVVVGFGEQKKPQPCFPGTDECLFPNSSALCAANEPTLERAVLTRYSPPQRLDQAAATEALAGLVPAWQTMTPHEQARVVRLLVSRVDFDGKQGKPSITFQPLGLKTLASEMLGRDQEEQSA
jgi:hypothetical protein